MFSVVILTLNEEGALPSCLASLEGCDDIAVLDSGSTDRTVEIAKAAGARVFMRPFDSFAGQRNYADRFIAFSHPWVFHLDADERMTPELMRECSEAARRTDLDGFRVAPRMLYRGRWLPHCTDYPAYQARFVRASSFEFIQVGHGQRESDSMRMGTLRENYLHDMSIYGDDAWLEKHRRYARAEALTATADSQSGPFEGLLCADALARRRALKRVAGRLPFRAQLRFVYQYLLRGGFLDGAEGRRYCKLLSLYEGFIAEEISLIKTAARAPKSSNQSKNLP